MPRTACALLDSTARDLAPASGANRLVPLIAAGRAPRAVLAAFVLEEHRIIAADRGSFAHLAARAAAEPTAVAFFGTLAQGEALAAETLPALRAALDLDEAAVRDHRPLPGCQAYSAYVAWLALHAEPSDAVLALAVNFAAWGGYCATVAQALRAHYGFGDEACAFFDLFAAPAPDLERQVLAAVQAGLDGGLITDEASHHGRLLQTYELMFWNTLADQAV